MYQSFRLGLSWEKDGPRGFARCSWLILKCDLLGQGMAQKAGKICLPSLAFPCENMGSFSLSDMIAFPCAMPRQLVCLGIACLLL